MSPAEFNPVNATVWVAPMLAFYKSYEFDLVGDALATTLVKLGVELDFWTTIKTMQVWSGELKLNWTFAVFLPAPPVKLCVIDWYTELTV